MTLEEIHQQLHQDFENTVPAVNRRFDEFKSAVLKSSRYPVCRRYEFKSLHSKNRFFVQMTALKRGEWKNPLLEYYCIYDRPEGLYCAIVAYKMGITIILPPHFFARYRERIVQDSSISTLDLIHLFMKRYWCFNVGHIPPGDEKEMRTWDKVILEDNVDLVGICPDGVIFGERRQDVFLIKTIVPETMLYSDQLNTYDRLRDSYIDYLYSTWPDKIVDYILNLEDDYYHPTPGASDSAIQQLRQKFNCE